jgi:SNF2 family DNA or RNA helicase
MKLILDQARRRAIAERCNETYMLRSWLRDVHGCKFKGGYWEFPLDLDILNHISTSIKHYGAEVTMTPEMAQWYKKETEARTILEQARNGGIEAKMHVEWKHKPFPHQVDGVEWLIASDWCMLLDDMGLGKTAQAITAANNLEKRSVIVVACPNTVKEVWAEEIAKFSTVPAMVLVPKGPTKIRKESILHVVEKANEYDGNRWIIVNYESLRFFSDAFLKATDGAILICDEAHRLKNARAKVTKIVEASTPRKLWLLTGTPIANRAEDLWSLMNIVRPGLAGFYWYDFERNYIIRNKFGGISRYQNLGFLADKLSRVSLGRKKENCIDLPDKLFEKRIVELSPTEKKTYKRMKDSMRTWLEDDVSEPPTISQTAEFTTRFIRLRQITDGLVSEGGDGQKSWSKELTKISEAIQAWEDSGRRRCVMWFQYVDVLKKAAEMLRRAQVGLIHGGVTTASRKEEIVQWAARDESILLCQMDTAGVGLNLQAGDLQIFVDLPLTPMQRHQCIDRLHRIGQQNSVTIVDIIAKETVDEKILATLAKKIDIANYVESKSYGLNAMKDMVK